MGVDVCSFHQEPPEELWEAVLTFSVQPRHPLFFYANGDEGISPDGQVL